LKDPKSAAIIDHKNLVLSIIQKGENKNIWAFKGQMGAGKTTLIKEICKELGVISEITSPSFSIVNEYLTKNNRKIYHFDLYRLKSIDEIYDIGYEEYIYSGNLCLIEWPEMIFDLLPQDLTLEISIELNPDQSRNYIFI